MIELDRQEYESLPETFRDLLALAVRPNWGMFFDSEWDEQINDLEVIEDTVFKSVFFRWLAGTYEVH